MARNQARWAGRIGASFPAAAFGLLALVCTCRGAETTPDIAPFNLPFAIAVADLNNDGLPDIAVAITRVSGAPPHAGFASVILQNPQGPGTFMRAVHYETGSDPLALAVGDLNGDGRSDIAVADSTSGNVSILMQDGSNPGQFLPQTKIHVGGFPSGIAIADIDGDGRSDIAIAAGNPGIRILFQDPSGPSGTFLAPVTLPLRSGSGALAIGDLNGDGVPDLVSASGVVSVLLQDPANRGSFFPAMDFRAGSQPIVVKIADLNGDGLPDLAVGNLDSASVLLQDSANPLSFLKSKKYKTGANTSDITVGDLNGDGRADLVTANSGSLGNFRGSVSVLLQKASRKGKLTFSRKNYAGRTGPFSVAITDLNGDGRPDIAVADGSEATVLFQRPDRPGVFFAPVIVGK